MRYPTVFPSRTSRLAFIALAVAGAASPAAFSQTIVVDTASADVDFGGSQTVADLPGPDGKVSLEEAGLASDNTPGVQTIAFHVPPSEWTYQWLFPGRAVLQPFLGFRVFQPVILDATTQTAFSGDTYSGGGEVVIWQESYLIDTVGSVVRGFDHSSFHISGGSHNTLQGNSLSGIEVFDSTDNVIGGVEPGQGNTCGTIQIDRASHNVVVGNIANRVRVLGWVDGGQPAVGNRIGGPTAAERNVIMGQGTWSSEGYPGGFAVQIFDAVGTVIENNLIGTTPDGMQQGHQATTSGIALDGQNHDTAIVRNRIAGILGHGIGPHYGGWLVGTAISVYGSGANVSILGNAIGLNAAGEPALGSVTGIAMINYYTGTVQHVEIGGPGPGDGNEIAGHLLTGVSVSNAYEGVRISRNSIHGNGAIGIDLVNAAFLTGVTANDVGDGDAGGNSLQNFPVLDAALATGAATTVQGSIASLPSQTFDIEFFASEACDASGYGEGASYLGTASAVTDSAGNGQFVAVLPVPLPPGAIVTATATHQTTGSTSEFSGCVVVRAGSAVLGDISGDGLVGGADLGMLLSAWGTPDAASDLDHDGTVNGLDLGILLANWS